MALAATSGSALADSPAERVTGGVFVGGGVLSDEVELGNSFFNDQVPGSGVLLGLRVAYDVVGGTASSGLNPRLGVEIETKLLLSSTGAADMRESAFAPVIGWRAHGVLDLFPHRRITPFVLAGAGGETLVSSSDFVFSPDTDAQLNLGVGAKYGVSERYGIRGDVRAGLTAGRFDAVAPTFEFHLGAFYRFGAGPPPPVEKNIIVVEKAPPPPPRPVDSDGDGIPDDRDRCPKQPEVVNEIDDEDGCPEVDSDNDGLLGTRDGCPDAAEDVDGFEDNDGCPDADNDGDGRPDVVDGCPMIKETMNGFEDNDGCPDKVPQAVARFTGVIKGIQFKRGSARILRRSRSTLDRAAEILKQYPSIEVEVSGHTDTEGIRKANMTLSSKRADYVKWYLVDAGVDAGRVKTVGLGPDKPIADNKTRAGRAKNRRIEFRLLPGKETIPDPRLEPAESGNPAGAPAPSTPAPPTGTP